MSANHPDSEVRVQPTARGRRRGRGSIRRRIIRLVLLPGVAAVVLALVGSGYLVFQGFYTRAVADSVRTVSLPAVNALTSIQQERRLSISFLAQPSGDLGSLVEQRKITDQRVSATRAAADKALAMAPDSIVSRWKELTGFLDQLPTRRTLIDSRSVSGQDAYLFYNDLLDAATALFDTQARVVPDVATTQGAIAAVEAFRVSDLMSRAASKIDGAFGAVALSQQDYLEFMGLVGGYRAGLNNTAPYWRPAVRTRYANLTSSEPWRELSAAENAIIAGGVWQDGVPRDLPITKDRWATLTQQVAQQLIDLTIAQADQLSAEALRIGNNQLLVALIASALALAVAAAAVVLALRQSREIPVRLARLGEHATELVGERLPEIMERLRRGEKDDDPGLALPRASYGRDEIGDLAAVLNRSLQTAAAAALDEAKTRAGAFAMLQGVATRPQKPLQRSLQLIDALQKHSGDEDTLARLFDVNHQLAQMRRFLENLLILSGGEIGRRFAMPVPVHSILLAASAESKAYKRVTVGDTPDAKINGQMVAAVVHLIAELIDNALTFSPPDTTVEVTSKPVGQGIVVEIEDAGYGMRPDALERYNDLLATAPKPDVNTLTDTKAIGLHVVAQLASRWDIKVTLRQRPSAYGGLHVIVLIPIPVIAGSQPAITPAAGVQQPAPPSLVASPPGDTTHRESTYATDTTPPSGTPLVAPPPSERWVTDAPRGVGDDQRDGMGVPRQAQPLLASVYAGSASPHSATRPTLPKRQPQQHLAPQLLHDPPPAATEAAAPPPSPEEVRDRLRLYQEGWQKGQQSMGFDDHGDQGRNA